MKGYFVFYSVFGCLSLFEDSLSFSHFCQHQHAFCYVNIYSQFYIIFSRKLSFLLLTLSSYEEEITSLKAQLEARRKEIASGVVSQSSKTKHGRNSVSFGKYGNAGPFNSDNSSKPLILNNGSSGGTPKNLRSPAIDSDGTVLAPIQTSNVDLGSQYYSSPHVRPAVGATMAGSAMRSKFKLAL